MNKTNIPAHVAIIMDGNGRWAKKQGKNRLFGHYKGVNSVKKVTEAAIKNGIPYLTLYTFSTENWERPKDEVDGLMSLLIETLQSEVAELVANGIKLQAIGDINTLPATAQAQLNDSIKATANGTRLTVIIALSYSSRWEIVQAAQKIAQLAQAGTIKPSEVDEQLFVSQLNTAQIPDPDLLIRTGGDQRMSNFLLFQAAYAELYFTKKKWPEFTGADFEKALTNYAKRQRRFGKTGEQITTRGNP